jgi:OmcA/MtrC family decaheme c-type cytochrome
MFRSLLLSAVCGVLVGCQGPDGGVGPQGPAGATGESGAMGNQGAQGQTGATGQNGQDGQNGLPGSQGDAGPSGRDLRYVGPGLVVTMLDAGVTDAGVATVDVKLTDDTGRALDRTGTFTEGAVTVSFVMGYLDERSDGLPLQYVSYTTRTVAVDGGSVLQNGADSNGVWTELDPVGSGLYRYRFGTRIDVGANGVKTHTIGAYSTRTVQTQRFVSNALFNFRPDRQPVVAKRDIVTTAACNTCHTRLEAHGGARREVGLCVMCHTRTNAIDPDTGNTFDFKVMIHNIHRGEKLPSVDAGVAYRFVGFNNSVSDFSDVVYPGNINDCDACHTGSQGARWKTNPSAESCSGCHDRTWFENMTVPAGFTLHTGGPRPDTQCLVCHNEMGLEPIPVKHLLPARDPKRLAVTASILSVPRVDPGTQPQVTFSVAVDGAPRDVLSQRLSRLRFTFAGPNADYARYYTETADTAADCATISDGGACLERLDAGLFVFHARAALLPTDRGSFTVGAEVCATSDAGVRWCAMNPVAPFAVTDATPVARRKAVTLTQCNQCHQSLAAHGGTRNNSEYCVLCHQANTVGNVAVPVDGGTVTAESVNFRNFVHTLHSAAAYPSPLNNCTKCHTATGWGLPVAAAALPSKSENRSCGVLPDGGSGAPVDGGPNCLSAAVVAAPVFESPTTSACISCHASAAAQVHAALNTTASGQESCAVCHAAGKIAGVDGAHALAP